MASATTEHPPLIDMELLLPGDVLLSTKKTFNSLAIRLATRSCYSHAALYLGHGVMIESTPDDGIAFAALSLVKVEARIKETPRRSLATVPGTTVLDVYRHPHMIAPTLSVDQKMQLSPALHHAVSNHWGKDYARLESLGDATRLLGWAPRLKRWMLDRIGRLGPDRRKIVPGAFCSQLVADVMADVGLDFLVKEVPRENVTPEMLADPDQSRLRQQLHVKCKADEHRPCDDAQLEKQRTILGSFVGLGMNRYRKGQHHAMAALAEIDASLAEQSQRMHARLNELNART